MKRVIYKTLNNRTTSALWRLIIIPANITVYNTRKSRNQLTKKYIYNVIYLAKCVY